MTDSFGENLRDLRVSRGLSRRALARTLGVSDTYLAHIEGGYLRPSEARCRQLAEALNVPADDLMASAGIVPQDVRAALCADPASFASLRSACPAGAHSDASPDLESGSVARSL